MPDTIHALPLVPFTKALQPAEIASGIICGAGEENKAPIGAMIQPKHLAKRQN